MSAIKIMRRLCVTFVCSSALFTLACTQGAAPNTNGNANAPVNSSSSATNINANTNVPVNTNVNSNMTGSGTSGTANSSGIEAREPETYRSNIIFTAQTGGGERVMALPQLTAEIARRSDDRRVAIKLPSGEQLIYLNKGATRYVVLPERKQYAEITKESVGFNLPELMTPGQIVKLLQTRSGYQQVGEEQMNGRTVVKYRYADTRNTGTQAGNVQAESFVFVDKDTGLPLRSELNAQTSGNVQNMNSLRVVAEMRDIQTSVDDAMFEVPPGLNKVSPEEMRQQINAVVAIATQLFGAMMSNMSNAPAATPATPSPATR